ncbi:hypothetical protein EYF80_015655 [Liparis tanakae]|uniref:Uncharacterized protein n=1 Tax=Liparis tanakae TaxID=230148 RepID=A0A4Z2I8K7_9TELE|nr:hypothetical protein EYF80_015655 [Liparis tanakae]
MKGEQANFPTKNVEGGAKFGLVSKLEGLSGIQGCSPSCQKYELGSHASSPFPLELLPGTVICTPSPSTSTASAGSDTASVTASDTASAKTSFPLSSSPSLPSLSPLSSPISSPPSPSDSETSCSVCTASFSLLLHIHS